MRPLGADHSPVAANTWPLLESHGPDCCVCLPAVAREARYLAAPDAAAIDSHLPRTGHCAALTPEAPSPASCLPRTTAPLHHLVSSQTSTSPLFLALDNYLYPCLISISSASASPRWADCLRACLLICLLVYSRRGILVETSTPAN